MTAMLNTHRTTLIANVLALIAMVCLYAAPGSLKAQIDLIDVISEGGIALMAGLWLVMILSSRPAGRVTRMLALGMPMVEVVRRVTVNPAAILRDPESIQGSFEGFNGPG